MFHSYPGISSLQCFILIFLSLIFPPRANYARNVNDIRAREWCFVWVTLCEITSLVYTQITVHKDSSGKRFLPSTLIQSHVLWFLRSNNLSYLINVSIHASLSNHLAGYFLSLCWRYLKESPKFRECYIVIKLAGCQQVMLCNSSVQNGRS